MTDYTRCDATFEIVNKPWKSSKIDFRENFVTFWQQQEKKMETCRREVENKWDQGNKNAEGKNSNNKMSIFLK